jgi:hypothetical protein
MTRSLLSLLLLSVSLASAVAAESGEPATTLPARSGLWSESVVEGIAPEAESFVIEAQIDPVEAEGGCGTGAVSCGWICARAANGRPSPFGIARPVSPWWNRMRLRQLAHEARMDLGDYDHTGSGARFFDGPAPVRKAPGAASGPRN